MTTKLIYMLTTQIQGGGCWQELELALEGHKAMICRSQTRSDTCKITVARHACLLFSRVPRSRINILS